MSDYAQDLDAYRAAVLALPDGYAMTTAAKDAWRLAPGGLSPLRDAARTVAEVLTLMDYPVPKRWRTADAPRVLAHMTEWLLHAASDEVAEFERAVYPLRQAQSEAGKKTTAKLRAAPSPLQDVVRAMELQLGSAATDRAISDALAARGWTTSPSSVNRARRALRTKGF